MFADPRQTIYLLPKKREFVVLVGGTAEMSEAQAGLSDQEFACLLFRSCGVPEKALAGALGINHAEECGFCLGTKQVDPRSVRR